MIQSVRDMYETGEWMDVTTGGSSFEVQLNQRTGQYRHRPRNFGLLNGVTLETAWTAGQPKEGKDNG